MNNKHDAIYPNGDYFICDCEVGENHSVEEDE